MAHNVTTLRDRAHHDPFGSLGPNLPVKGDALLTVRGGLPERPATILFHHGWGSAGPQVVLHPWETDGANRTVVITGEDLFAFRELLNELPESAFVRPADPVEKPPWTDGDIVKPSADSVVTYIRRDGKWDRVARDKMVPAALDDAMINGLVRGGYFVVLQKNA